MKLIIAGILTASAVFGAITNVTVRGTTAPQAVITAHGGGALTIEVSESSTYSPLVYATDSAKGGTAAAKFDDGSGNYTFVIGKRNSALGTDGHYYSQALQTATQHFYRITDASDASTATGSFATPTPASVVTGDDMPLISPGLAGWPSRVNFGDRNERWIDPQTGVQLRPLVLPGDAQDTPTSAASGLIDKATNVGAAAWTGLANIASTSPGTYTSFVGTGSGTQGWVFIRATNFLVPGGPNWGGTQISYGSFGSDITYWNFLGKGNTTATGCGSSGLDKCKVQACLTVNGVTCATGIVDVELNSTADTAIAIGTGDQAPGLHFWMAGASNPASPPEKQDMNRRINLLNASFPTTTGVRVETDNQTVTWLSGSRFNQALVAGSWVKLGNDFCQIANNGQDHAGTTYNSRVIELANNTCYTGVQSPTGITATFANFGVLIRKKSATADTVNINSADYSFGITPDLIASISGVNEACATAYAPGNAGLDKGYYCRFLSAGNNGLLYWINSITGEARMVGNMGGPIMAKTGASDTWNTIRFNGPNNILHDNTHPGTFYGQFQTSNNGNLTAIFKIVINDPTHKAATDILPVNSQDRFTDVAATNLCSSISPGGGTYGWDAATYTQTCRLPNQTGTVSYQILTPPSLVGKSLTQQLATFTASDPYPFNASPGYAGQFPETSCAVQYVSNGKPVGTCSNANSDVMAWLWVFDPGDGVTAHAGLAGGPRVVAAKPGWLGSGCSWCVTHAIVNPGDVDILPTSANKLGYNGFSGSAGSGPERSRMTGWCSGTGCTPTPCTLCTLPLGTPGDLITVSVDGQPQNSGINRGTDATRPNPGPGDYGNWTVGDYIIFCDSASASCLADGNGTIYEIGQIKSNPSSNRYVIERGHNSTLTTPGPNHALTSATIYIDGYCMAQNINGCLFGNCKGGYAYWDYIADPHGRNLAYSVTGDPDAIGPLNTVRKDNSDTGSHRTFRSNNNLFVHDLTTAAAANYSGSAYGVRSGPLAGFYGLPDTGVASAGYFNNIGGTKVATTYQSHAYRGTNSGLTFFDGVPFFGGSSTGTATVVSKNLYKLTSTCSSPCDVTTGNTTLHRKLWPTIAASGRFPMQDISGPGSSITDAGSDAYKYCFVRIAGECFSGSAVGDAYYNLPNMTATGTHACAAAGATSMYSGNDDQTLFCLGDSMMFNQSHLAEIQFIPPIDSRHVIGRNLTRGFSRYLMSHDFLTPVVLADGSWAITMAPFWSGGGYSLVLAKMPPLMTDSTVRSTFVPRQVVAHSSEVPALTVTAYVKYGYEEHGAYNSFYCTSRQEACAVGTDTWPTYSFLVTDTVTPKACDTGCSFTIPALAGRVGFAQIVFLDNGSVTTGSGPIVAFATN